jgi:hypothetical protein
MFFIGVHPPAENASTTARVMAMKRREKGRAIVCRFILAFLLFQRFERIA